MTPTNYPAAERIGELISGAQHILVMQADNPDADSLASALALEQILGDLDKEPYLYCGVHIPDYLRHLEGWDRVGNELPATFDLSIIVDTSADSLFGVLAASGSRQLVASKPCVIIDHHPVEPSIPYATAILNAEAASTGEVIYELAQQLSWPVNQQAGERIVTSILADSMGLTTESTSGRTIHIVGNLVESGVKIAELDQKRRLLMKKSPELILYKARLMQRIEYHAEGRIATVTIPWEEIEKYSHSYNPSILVIDEMRSATDVLVAIAFKIYNDGKITAKIRANYGAPVVGDLAAHFGGGGHAYSSGFKLTGGRSFDEVKQESIEVTAKLLDKLKQDGIES